MEVKPRMRFRFGDERDIAKYGDGWWVYDEAAITGLSARRLIELEAAISMPYFRVMEGVREPTTVGLLAAMWIALTLAGQKAAWDEFDPIVFRTRWEEDPAPLDPGEDPAQDSSSLPGPTAATA